MIVLYILIHFLNQDLEEEKYQHIHNILNSKNKFHDHKHNHKHKRNQDHHNNQNHYQKYNQELLFDIHFYLSNYF